MFDEKTMMEEMMSSWDVETYRASCRKRYPLYDKYAQFQVPPWSKSRQEPGQEALDGSGPFKWPAVGATGKCTVPALDPTARWKMTSNVWRDTYFMMAKVLTDELGTERASEFLAYLWYGLASKMEGFNRHFLKDKPRDCVTLSKAFQMEILLEGHDFDVVEEAPDKCVVRFQCAYWADFKNTWEPLGVDIREPLCNQGCTGWSKVWAHMVNPKIRFRKTKYIGAGDDCCEFTWEMQG